MTTKAGSFKLPLLIQERALRGFLPLFRCQYLQQPAKDKRVTWYVSFSHLRTTNFSKRETGSSNLVSARAKISG